MGAGTRKRDNSGIGVIILEENLVQIGLMIGSNRVVDIQRSSVSPGYTFFTWKMESKLCVNLQSCRKLFVELEYLDHNPQTILEPVEQFSTKLITCVFHLTSKSWNLEELEPRRAGTSKSWKE